MSNKAKILFEDYENQNDSCFIMKLYDNGHKAIGQVIKLTLPKCVTIHSFVP